ncbi:MAG: metallophosphatase family protein [bacterium]|nr:metallophosphatase family protein [bacterium]
MLIGILADTHNQIARTEQAVDLLRQAGVELLVHCGDLNGPEIIETCAKLPLNFVLGNHDGDMARALVAAADQFDATYLGWGGEFEAGGKRIAVVHGHLKMDLKPLLDAEPDYLLSGHSHASHDFRVGKTRRINPGALHRASEFSVATLNVDTDRLEFLNVPR